MNLSDFPQIEMILQGDKLPESDLNFLSSVIRPDKLVALIKAEKNSTKSKQLRSILTVLHPNYKQYRWNKPKAKTDNEKLTMLSRFKKEDSIKSVVSGGNVNSTGKRR